MSLSDAPATAEPMPARKRRALTTAERMTFVPLRVSDVRRETADAVSIAFDIPPEAQNLFAFEPGQYLALRTTLGGEDIRRSYSISSALGDGEIRIAIKRVEGGAFSAHAVDALRVGDVLDALPPAGRFVLPDASGPRTIVAIAAGSGITPIASQLRTVLAREPDANVFLFYGNQTSRSIIFRELIEDLKDSHMGRFSVHNVLSREAQDVAALNGHIDGEKLALFMRHVVPLESVDHFLMCGPAAFLEQSTEALEALGVPPARILLERFTTPGQHAGAKAAKAAGAAETTDVAVTLDGVTTRLKVAPSQTIMAAGLEAGLDVPYSCQGGMCCTCRARITDGTVAMDVNFSLREDEIANGFVLTCQSKPTAKSVAVDFDAA